MAQLPHHFSQQPSPTDRQHEFSSKEGRLPSTSSLTHRLAEVASVNPGKTSITAQLSPGLLDDPMNCKLINDYFFKLLNLGVICYASKAN